MKKLLRFFERSRDKWKTKCQTAKQENKSLKIRLAKMKASRDCWKAKAQCVGDMQVWETPPPKAETKKDVRPGRRGPGAGGARPDVGAS
jgi:hypothetical protein